MTDDASGETPCSFRGRIVAAFEVMSRGTFLTFGLDFDGRIRVGDRVSVPVAGGAFQEFIVSALEMADSPGDGRAWLALGIGAHVRAVDVVVGGIVWGN